MIIDAYLRMSNQQAVTAATESTNVIDLGIARDIGTGEDLYAVFQVHTTLDDAGDDSTLECKLQADNDEAFGSVDSSQIVGTFPANAAAGTMLYAKLSPGLINSRYLRAYYTPANGNLSAGKINAFLVKDIQKFVAYADNIKIS